MFTLSLSLFFIAEVNIMMTGLSGGVPYTVPGLSHDVRVVRSKADLV